MEILQKIILNIYRNDEVHFEGNNLTFSFKIFFNVKTLSKLNKMYINPLFEQKRKEREE